ncbi:hypothetical protein BH23CHL6_BH23CHL6_01400 [soil metagenome]
MALYRSEVARDLPAGVPADAAATARDTLGGAVGVALQLPADVRTALLEVAQGAFVHGMQVAAVISAVVATVVAVVAVTLLRNVGHDGPSEEPEAQFEAHGAAVPEVQAAPSAR